MGLHTMPTAQVLTLTLLTLIGLTYATPTLLETLPYSSNDFPETIAPIVSVSSDGASAYALLLIELPDSGVTVSMQKCSLGQGAPDQHHVLWVRAAGIHAPPDLVLRPEGCV